MTRQLCLYCSEGIHSAYKCLFSFLLKDNVRHQRKLSSHSICPLVLRSSSKARETGFRSMCHQTAVLAEECVLGFLLEGAAPSLGTLVLDLGLSVLSVPIALSILKKL